MLLTPRLWPRYDACMKFYQGNPPQSHPRYKEIAEMARELGLNVKDTDTDYIDDVLLSRRGLELLVRD